MRYDLFVDADRMTVSIFFMICQTSKAGHGSRSREMTELPLATGSLLKQKAVARNVPRKTRLIDHSLRSALEIPLITNWLFSDIKTNFLALSFKLTIEHFLFSISSVIATQIGQHRASAQCIAALSIISSLETDSECVIHTFVCWEKLALPCQMMARRDCWFVWL